VLADPGLSEHLSGGQQITPMEITPKFGFPFPSQYSTFKFTRRKTSTQCIHDGLRSEGQLWTRFVPTYNTLSGEGNFVWVAGIPGFVRLSNG